MSRRKQANPQHVHDAPGPNGKVIERLTNIGEVLPDSERFLTEEPGAESNKGIMQRDSSHKQSTQHNQLLELFAMEGNVSAPTGALSPGKKSALAENSFPFPAGQTNDQPMSDRVQLNTMQMDEDDTSRDSSSVNVIREEMNMIQQLHSTDIARSENGETAEESCQEEPMDNEAEKLSCGKFEASSQESHQSTGSGEDEIKDADAAAQEHDVSSVNMTSPCDDVKSPVSNKREDLLLEDEQGKDDPDCVSVKENFDPRFVKNEVESSDPNEAQGMQTSPDDEKENRNEGSMMNGICSSQQFIFNAKLAKVAPEKNKELSDIRDQMRMLQQQQAYQVQMLNYLHVQLTLLASNPQAQKVLSGMFQSQGLNGFQLQNMPHLLSSSVAGSGSLRPSEGGILPSMAAAMGLQLSAGSSSEFPQTFEMLNGMRERKLESGPSENSNGTGKVTSEGENSHEPYNPLSSLTKLQKPSGSRPNGVDLFSSLPQNSLEGNATDGFMKHACRFCQKIFGSDSALQIHLRSHTGERPFKCNICGNRFSTKGNLKVHFVRHKDKYPNIEMNAYPVPEDLDNVPTSSGIPYGMSILPDEEDSKPTGTDAMDGRPSLPSSHRTQAELPIPFQSVDGPRKINPSHQDDDNTNEAVLADDRSNQSFVEDDTNGSRRKEVSEDDKKAPTPASGGSFSNRALNEEQTNTIKSSLPNVISSSSMLPTSRKSWEEFSAMRNVGANGKPITSSSETTKLQQLVEQIDRSKDLDKNECHICHRILSCQSALKLHYRTHTGERPYKCDLCSRAFTTRGNLRTHYSSVHRQQLRNNPPENNSSTRGASLQCPVCLYHFPNQESMQQHMRMHILMQSRQQQAAQIMTSNGSRVDYRILSMMGGGFQPNLSTFDKDFQDAEVKTDPRSAENDDVFEESTPGKSKSPQEMEETVEESTRLSEKNNPVYSQQNMTAEKNPYLLNFQAVSRERSAFEKEDEVEKRSDNAALDLSRPGSNSSSSTVGTKRNSPVSSFLVTSMDVSSPASTTSSSLSALASLASNGPILRPDGLSSLNAHMTSVKEEARARKMTTACEICTKPFTCQSALEIHLRSHTKERPFVCRVCDRRFTTKGNLKQHLLTHDITDVDDDMLEPVFSPTQGNSNPSSPSNSPSLTNEAYPGKRSLEASQSAPPAKRSYPRHWCHICQKQFSSASSLQIHNRTHTGEKPFACSVCGRAFTTKGNLKVHMGTHVWGAGGSRRGRRISMDNPLISPWMQNTSVANIANPPLRPRLSSQIPAVPDQTAIYQQYAALASGLMGAKAAADARLQGNQMMNFNNAAVRLLMPNNLVASSPMPATSDDKTADPALKESNSNAMTAAATEWIWKAYQQTQEQVN